MKTTIAISLVAATLAAATTFAQQPARALERMDRDGDGRVTREEFQGPAEAFDRFDRNGDGVLSREDAARARPQPAAPRIGEDVEVLRDVPYVPEGHPRQAMDILRLKDRPAEPAPAIVFIHGGAWRSGDKSAGVGRLAPLVERGFVCATINYRLTGDAQFPAQIEDCKTAIRFLRAHAVDYGIDPERIGVWGSSAGGHLVAMLGVAGDVAEFDKGPWEGESSRVQAVCDWFGPADLTLMTRQRSAMDHSRADSPEGFLLGGAVSERQRMAELASPVNHVSGDDAPFLIMHGTEDPTVPYGQSVALATKLMEAGVEVDVVPMVGAGHGGKEFSSASAMERIVAFFERTLRAPVAGRGGEGAPTRPSDANRPSPPRPRPGTAGAP